MSFLHHVALRYPAAALHGNGRTKSHPSPTVALDVSYPPLSKVEMAELIGLAASVVTLTEVLEVGLKALAKLKACYNAPPEIARIRAEVERLAKLLANVEDFAKMNSSCPIDSGLAECVSLAASRVASINQILETSVFGIEKLSDANKARTTILRYRTRLGNLEDQLKASIHEISVHLCLAIA